MESQRQELRRYAEREGLKIIGAKEEARSAKSPGRPIFNELLKCIDRGEANGILAWHPDRLARNALDGGQVIQLLDTAKLIDLRFPTYTFENTSQGKFMLAIMFGQSKYYVDSLSENVRRGNRTKRERGWLPGPAPIGYRNSRSESGEKIIEADPIRFPLLKQLWELFLTGGYSVPQLVAIGTHQMGLRTMKRKRIGGAPVSVSAMHRILSNPFYAGHLVYQNQWSSGRQDPMITVEQFERVQMLLGKTSRARAKTHVFAYSGLMRCGSCGGSITAEEKVNRYGSHYAYYHCTHRKRDVVCYEKCAEEGQLQKQILLFLNGIYLDQRDVDRLLAVIEDERLKERYEGGGIKRSVQGALESCARNLDNLTKLRYRDLIGDEEFIRQRKDLTREQSKLTQRLQQLSTEQWIEPSQNLFLFSNRAAFWLTHGTASERRLILSSIGSNLTLQGKELSIDAKEPFRILQKHHSFTNPLTVVNDVRTFFRAESVATIPLLPEPGSAVAA